MRVPAPVTRAALAAGIRLRSALPSALLPAAIAVTAHAAWWLMPARRAALESNARWFGHDATCRRHARTALRHFVRCGADLLALSSCSSADIRARVSFHGRDHLDAALRLGRGVIIVTPHLGNWDWGGAALGALGLPVTAFAESIDPARDAAFTRLRTSTGGRLVPPSARGVREALAAIRRGGIVCTVGDRALGDARRLAVPFGHGVRNLPVGPAWLAIKTGAPVIVAYCVLSGDGACPYRCTFEAPIAMTGLGADPVSALTMGIAARLSAAVLAHSDQWFVFQPDWQPVIRSA